MTGRNAASSEFFVDADPTLTEAAASKPTLALDGETPRLIDEWQILPQLWNYVRRAIDDRQKQGQFILTGSAVPADDVTRHSGAGRFSRLRMYPLTLFESGKSLGKVSLKQLLNGSDIWEGASTLTYDSLLDFICAGGWPGNMNKSLDDSLSSVRDYLNEMQRIDIARLNTTQKGRNPKKIGAVVRSLSRGIGTAMSVATIMADVKVDDDSVVKETVSAYLNALESVMLLDYVFGWSVHLRSKATLRSNPKHYFTDPSIAVAALAASPLSLQKDPRFLGQLFENLVMRELQVFAQHNNANLFYYRDSYDLEVDAIVERIDGSWLAIEIKLGSASIESGAATLKKFEKTVDTTRKGEPAALIVITGDGYCYKRDDGVQVIPIGVLCP